MKTIKFKFDFEKILSFIVWAGIYSILLTPFIFDAKLFFPFITGKAFYFMFLTEIIFFFWVILALFYPKYRPKISALTLAVLLFIISYFLGTIFGVDFQHSFWGRFERMGGFILFLHLLLFYLVLVSFVQSKVDWLKMIFVLAFSGAIMGVLTFIEKVYHIEIIAGDKGGLSFGNDSFLATYLLIALFAALLLFFAEPTKEKKIFFLSEKKDAIFIGGLFFVSIMAGLLKSNGRAAILSSLIGLFLIYLLYLSFYEKNRGLNIFSLIVLFTGLLVGIILIINLLIPDSFSQQLLSVYTTKGRMAVWQASIEMLKEKPIFGWGPENLEFGFNKYFNPKMFLAEYGGETRFDKAHNVIFDTLVDAGILGLFSLLLIYFFVFYILWKKYRQKQANFFLSSILFVFFVSHFLQNLTVFDTPASYILWFFMIGFVDFLGRKKENKKKEEHNKTPLYLRVFIIFIVFVAFISSLTYFVAKPYLSCLYMASAIREKNDPEARFVLYQKAINLSPISKYSKRETFARHTYNLFQEEKAPKEELEFVVCELKKTIQESPLDLYSYYYLGKIYNNTYSEVGFDKLNEAEQVLTKAVNLFPTNQYCYWVLAYTKMHQDKYDEALDIAEKALALEPRVYYSHIVTIEIAKEKGDSQLLLEKTNRFLNYFPDKKEEIYQLLKK